MRFLKYAAALAALTSQVEGKAEKQGEPVDWEKNHYDVDEYFKGIDDYIDMNEWKVNFKLIHGFILGFQQGLWNNENFSIDEDCFGERWVNKLNQYEYLFYGDPFGNFYENFFPEMSLTYQFYYMIFNTCRLDNTVQEFMVFCWYRGCWPKEIVLNSKDKWLYILRDLNDEGISWSDAYPRLPKG